MKMIAILILLISVFPNRFSFAEAADDNAITQQEIAQTLKNMNELIAESRASPKTDDGKIVGSYEKLDLQRASDIMSDLEDTSGED